MIKYKKGTSSPYWDWAMRHQNNKYADGDIWEPVGANPDQSSEPMYEQRDGDNFKEYILSNSLVKKIEVLCTRREKDVIKLLQKGYNQNEVAKRLHIAESTVKTLVQRIRYKAQNLVVQKVKYGDITRDRKLV